MLGESGSRYALVISLLAHAALLAVTTVVAAREPEPQVGRPLPWDMADGAGVAQSGNTFEIEGLVDEPEVGDGDDRSKPATSLDADTVPQPVDDESDAAPPPAAAAPSGDEPARRPQPTRPAAAPAAAPPHTAEAAGAGSATSNGGIPKAASAGDRDADGGGRGRRYGAAGDVRGVRNFAPAFTRALPAAVSSDEAWARLPLGAVGRFELTVEVDADSRIASHRIEPKDAPAPLRRLIKRTMPLLAGEFSLARGMGAGSETLRIDVTLSQREPVAELVLGHELPTVDDAGRAYFTLSSGRHFEAVIVVLRSASHAAKASDDEPEQPAADD